MGTVPALTDETPLDQYTATASQTDFTFTFTIFATADIKVYVNDILKTETTDYIVKQADLSPIVPADDLPMDGGKIVFNSGLILNDKVSISREIPIDRLTGYSVAGDFRANVLNAELTRMQSIMQQLERDITRSVRLSASDAETGSLQMPSGRASKFLAFDSSGNMIASAGTIGITPITVSSFMETVLDDSTAATARATLAAQQDVITTRGDITRGNSSGVAERLALGTTGQVLKSDGTDLVFGEYRDSTTAIKGQVLLPNPITISNGTDADHDIDFSAGNFQFDDGSGQAVATALTKKLDASWVAGTNQGGLDTGSIAANTWYYCFAIYNPTTSTADSLFSASYSSPTLPSGYTKKEYRGAVLTDASSNIRNGNFTYFGKSYRFSYKSQGVQDHSGNGNPGNTTLSCPPNSYAIIDGYISTASVNVNVSIQETSHTSDSLAFLAIGDDADGIGRHIRDANQVQIKADSSSQVNISGTTATTVTVKTRGWIEYIL